MLHDRDTPTMMMAVREMASPKGLASSEESDVQDDPEMMLDLGNQMSERSE